MFVIVFLYLLCHIVGDNYYVAKDIQICLVYQSDLSTATEST